VHAYLEYFALIKKPLLSSVSKSHDHWKLCNIVTDGSCSIVPVFATLHRPRHEHCHLLTSHMAPKQLCVAAWLTSAMFAAASASNETKSSLFQNVAGFMTF
jgi:hypothetical protein